MELDLNLRVRVDELETALKAKVIPRRLSARGPAEQTCHSSQNLGLNHNAHTFGTQSLESASVQEAVESSTADGLCRAEDRGSAGDEPGCEVVHDRV